MCEAELAFSPKDMFIHDLLHLRLEESFAHSMHKLSGSKGFLNSLRIHTSKRQNPALCFTQEVIPKPMDGGIIISVSVTW